jgi:1-deoxy-D-xylulose-5-phosphate reductoisomerase
VADLDFFAMPSLGFETPDEVRFPCLRLAREAFLAGKSAAAVLNAANEVTVEAFLAGKIRFTDIARINEAVLTQSTLVEPDSIDVVIAADHEARRLARELF